MAVLAEVMQKLALCIEMVAMTRRFSQNGATIDASMFERFAFIDLQGVDERQIYKMSKMGKIKNREL